jgi:hypothetical protein
MQLNLKPSMIVDNRSVQPSCRAMPTKSDNLFCTIFWPVHPFKHIRSGLAVSPIMSDFPMLSQVCLCWMGSWSKIALCNVDRLCCVPEHPATIGLQDAINSMAHNRLTGSQKKINTVGPLLSGPDAGRERWVWHENPRYGSVGVQEGRNHSRYRSTTTTTTA